MKGWRTIIVACVAFIVGAVLIMFGPEDTRDVGVTLIVAGMGMAGMRTITTTPITQKDEWAD